MAHLTQYLLAFVEGLALIASPCILPILPIMLAASLDGGRKRPLGIITGFIAAFTAFALLSRQILAWLEADPTIVRNVALGLLVSFGAVMLSKKLSDRLLGATQGLADLGQNLTSRWDQKDGFFSGVAIGSLIGLIWTPCAGPILAAAVVGIIQAKTNVEAALTVAAFAIGAGIPMLVIALAGRQIMARLTFLKTHSYAVRRVLGALIIAMAVLIYLGLDVKLLASVESSKEEPVAETGTLQEGLEQPYPAPEIEGIKDWINTEPLEMKDLLGKVVLVDFWTYSCINCVRTLPYLTKWYAKYKDKGFVILGVHSPEFEFEKKLSNVKDAVMKFGISYPVGLDSNLYTWSNFKNRYWPAHYLINKEGQVVYTHFGEGHYDVTENNIRYLLGMRPGDVVGELSKEDRPAASSLQTHETYLGYSRAKNFTSKIGTAHDAVARYSFPPNLVINNWALEGDWMIGPESITSKSEKAALRLNFIAKKVFLVLGTREGTPIHVRIKLNDKSPGKMAGDDVKEDVITVDQEMLYELINQDVSKNGILEIQADEPGLQAYAFTFGG